MKYEENKNNNYDFANIFHVFSNITLASLFKMKAARLRQPVPKQFAFFD